MPVPMPNDTDPMPHSRPKTMGRAMAFALTSERTLRTSGMEKKTVSQGKNIWVEM